MKDVEVISALDRAWVKMEDALFKPFDFISWMQLSLVAWLAFLWKEWLLLSPWSFVVNTGLEAGGKTVTSGALALSLPGLVVIAGLFVLGALGCLIIGAWLKSRADFVLLHNMAQNDSSIAVPWKTYAKLGDSAFQWRLGYGIFYLFLQIVFASLGVLCFMEWIREMINAKTIIPPNAATLCLLVIFILLLLFSEIILALVRLLFKDITLPLMYKRNIPVLEALKLTASLLGSAPFAFLKYILTVFLLNMILCLALTLFGILLCCLAPFYFVVMGIPFVWAALTLPLLLWLRLFSMEFLAAFGEEYDCFRKNPET